MKNIVPIISGKGGVGKSTVASSLAIALAKTGAKVALVDADLYGPSVPTLFGGGDVKVDHNEKLVPPEKFGVKYISIGFFLPNQDDPVIWRGPRITKALQQLFQDVNWGVVDYCIVDMPPGTGDTQISLCQMLKLTGALVVTTPQEIALADVRKAINMLEKVEVPILGIIENMSGLTLPNGETMNLFGEGGGEALAIKYSTEVLAKIPIDIELRKGGDIGEPTVNNEESASYKIFNELALKLIDILDKRNGEINNNVTIIN